MYTQQPERLDIFPANVYCLCQNMPCTDRPPLPEAVLYEVRQVGRCPVDRVEKVGWFESGVNHRQVGEYWYRDTGTEYRWFLKINDIAAFVCENGNCRITSDPAESFLSIHFEDNDDWLGANNGR